MQNEGKNSGPGGEQTEWPSFLPVWLNEAAELSWTSLSLGSWTTRWLQAPSRPRVLRVSPTCLSGRAQRHGSQALRRRSRPAHTSKCLPSPRSGLDNGLLYKFTFSPLCPGRARLLQTLFCRDKWREGICRELLKQAYVCSLKHLLAFRYGF